MYVKKYVPGHTGLILLEALSIEPQIFRETVKTKYKEGEILIS